MDYSGKLNGLYTESHTGGCFTLYRSGENKQRELGELGQLGQLGEIELIILLYFDILP